jgi:membrane protein YdbS with pleckstrin-like domain
MGSHPLNLILRFILEIATLFAYGYWGWTGHEGIWRYVWSIGTIVLAAAVWGTFAVPEDPSRSGKAPVPIPGLLRLVLELVFFSAGVWAFFAADQPLWGTVLGAATLIHYALSYDRIKWLLGR